MKRAGGRPAPVLRAGDAVLALIVCLLAAIGAAGCGGVTGSGKLVTTDMHMTGFTQVKAADSWKVTVVRGDKYGVKITCDDNVVDRLDVTVDGSALVLRLKHGVFTNHVTLEATVVMPTLSGVGLSDASEGSVTGFSSDGPLAVDVHDASSVELDGLRAATLVAVVGDASSITGSIHADDVSLRLSDAANATLSGSTRVVTLKASDACSIDLGDLSATDVSATLSDACSATVSVDGTLDARVSDASELKYVGSPTLGDVHTSDDSSLERAGE